MISIRLTTRFIEKKNNSLERCDRTLCFTCAVKAVIERGAVIETETDELGVNGNDMRTTWCEDCEASL